jgi:uncharacterized protein YoxC
MIASVRVAGDATDHDEARPQRVLQSPGVVVAALIASVALAALAVAAILTLLQLRRTAEAAQQTLTAVEREVRPLAADLHALLEAHRELAHGAGRSLRELERSVTAAHEVLTRVGRVASLLGSVGTVGKLFGLAHGARRAAAVFLRLLGRRRR